MIRFTLTIFGFIFYNLLFSQQFNPSIISNGGGTMSNSNVIATFTIGEPVSDNISNNSAIFSQGFQQGRTALGISENSVNNQKISVYPNPAKDVINISFIPEIKKGINVELIDVNGRVLFKHKNADKTSDLQINISDYSESIYLLRITTLTGVSIRSYKIQKIN